jgi:hypothetical protein
MSEAVDQDKNEKRDDRRRKWVAPRIIHSEVSEAESGASDPLPDGTGVS